MVINSEAFRFDLSGGALCLDFVNTVSDRGLEDELDHIGSYADLLAFGRQSGALPDEEVEELAAQAAGNPDWGARATGEAVRVREALYRLFAAIAEEREPPEEDLETLNSALVEGLAYARLVRDGDAYRWSWAGDCSCLERPLWQIVHSAADLLASGRLDRVRLCDSDRCEWLFLDESRNRSRRWCDMSTCGNRAKARRHYRRARARAD